MVQVLLGVHLLTAVIIIGLILLQQGKGAEAGASFGGGASQTMFGSAGSWNFFSRMTAIFATVFFVTSISLAVVAKKSAVVEDPYLPEMEQVEIPETTESAEIPAIDSSAPESAIPALDSSAPVSDEVPENGAYSEQNTIEDLGPADDALEAAPAEPDADTPSKE